MLESISLDIANYWTSNDFLTESNDRCGTLVAFDWLDGYLTGINTNIDLDEVELENFKFDDFVEFLKKNNFTFVLGLRNISYTDNPSPEWTEKLKEILKSNEIDYDEYIIGNWPSPIPEFDVSDNVFILRYSYDEYNKLDKFAAHNSLFKDFIENSDWGKYYRDANSEVKTRVIVLCNDIENLILHESFDK
jgi:hypothetical protein